MEYKSNRKKLLGKLISDSAWSIAGLVPMNCVAQFAVYPIWNRNLGNEIYGHILYLLSVMNVFSISVGMACNYGRMKASVTGETENRIYT